VYAVSERVVDGGADVVAVVAIGPVLLSIFVVIPIEMLRPIWIAPGRSGPLVGSKSLTYGIPALSYLAIRQRAIART